MLTSSCICTMLTFVDYEETITCTGFCLWEDCYVHQSITWLSETSDDGDRIKIVASGHVRLSALQSYYYQRISIMYTFELRASHNRDRKRKPAEIDGTLSKERL